MFKNQKCIKSKDAVLFYVGFVNCDVEKYKISLPFIKIKKRDIVNSVDNMDAEKGSRYTAVVY